MKKMIALILAAVLLLSLAGCTGNAVTEEPATNDTVVEGVPEEQKEQSAPVKVETDTPKEEAPQETPKEETPKEEAPKEEAPKEEPPKEETPTVDKVALEEKKTAELLALLEGKWVAKYVVRPFDYQSECRDIEIEVVHYLTCTDGKLTISYDLEKLAADYRAAHREYQRRTNLKYGVAGPSLTPQEQQEREDAIVASYLRAYHYETQEAELFDVYTLLVNGEDSGTIQFKNNNSFKLVQSRWAEATGFTIVFNRMI